MIELTEQQRQALDAAPPRLMDPVTRKVYVLLSDDVYDRIQDLLVPGRLTQPEQQALLRAAGKRAGGDDPEMDVYDREDASPPTPRELGGQLFRRRKPVPSKH